MSREKLLSITPHTPHSRKLQQLLLEYHEFRQQRQQHPLATMIDELGEWQIHRLKQTHADLYETAQYHDALEFLLKDLYAPKEFTRRDADLERIFPKMVKLLPEQALGIVADLVELNLLTQKLDEHMAVIISEDLGYASVTEAIYLEAFRRSDNLTARHHQIRLIDKSGRALEKIVKSRFLSFSLAMTEGAAEMAGLGQLHQFITRGFRAFRAIGAVTPLLSRITSRESLILERISQGHPQPFTVDDQAAC